MRTSDRKKNLNKANLLAESLHKQRLSEDYDYASVEKDYNDNAYHENDEAFNQYVEAIKANLIKLDSGDTIIKVIDGDFSGPTEKYANSTWAKIKDYFRTNFEKGFSAEDTASHVRAKWYGV